MAEAKKYVTPASFRQGLEERLKTLSRSDGIDIMRLRRQVAFDRLLARLFHATDTPWVLKGGYAMELRIDRARTTKDLDLGLKVKPGRDLLELVQQQAAKNLDDFFTFIIGETMMELDAAPYGGERYPVEARMDGRTFIKLHLDIGIGDDGLEPNETLQGRDWLAFAGLPAPVFTATPAAQQFAEKLHAYTLIRKTPNTRVKDLVDMVLLINLGTLDRTRVNEGLRKTFARRNTHSLPDRLEPPSPAWERPFRALAEECGLDRDITQAFAILTAFYLGDGPGKGIFDA